jgi:hypothetical protein
MVSDSRPLLADLRHVQGVGGMLWDEVELFTSHISTILCLVSLLCDRTIDRLEYISRQSFIKLRQCNPPQTLAAPDLVGLKRHE